MIYRIRVGEIISGKWEFTHYATDEELVYLRVNVNGRVEQMNMETISRYDDEKYDVFDCWLDVSDTHQVEYGMPNSRFSNPVYENDILGYGKGGMWILRGIFDLYEEEKHVQYRGIDYDKAPIGNVHENQNMIDEYYGK